MLRAHDRHLNEWPALHLREVYLLKGGYKEFYQAQPTLCEPSAYVPMLHPDYRAECDRLMAARARRARWIKNRSKSMSALAHTLGGSSSVPLTSSMIDLSRRFACDAAESE